MFPPGFANFGNNGCLPPSFYLMRRLVLSYAAPTGLGHRGSPLQGLPLTICPGAVQGSGPAGTGHETKPCAAENKKGKKIKQHKRAREGKNTKNKGPSKRATKNSSASLSIQPGLPVEAGRGGRALVGGAQLVGALPYRSKGHRFDSQSKHMPGLRVWSLVGAPTIGNRSMFLSHVDVSLPPLPLKPICMSWGAD